MEKPVFSHHPKAPLTPFCTDLFSTILPHNLPTGVIKRDETDPSLLQPTLCFPVQWGWHPRTGPGSKDATNLGHRANIMPALTGESRVNARIQDTVRYCLLIRQKKSVCVLVKESQQGLSTHTFMSKAGSICPVFKILHMHSLKHCMGSLRSCRVDLMSGTITYMLNFVHSLQ